MKHARGREASLPHLTRGSHSVFWDHTGAKGEGNRRTRTGNSPHAWTLSRHGSEEEVLRRTEVLLTEWRGNPITGTPDMVTEAWNLPH